MKVDATLQLRLIVGATVGVTLLSLLAISQSSSALAQDKSNSGQADKKMSMECPMMTGLEGIKLTADSPPLLMANARELQLTDEQQQKLKMIAKEAQRKAGEVLTGDQRSKLGEASGKAMSMMEIAMMRAKKSGGAASEMMCPMCKEKMDGMKGMMMKKMKESNRPSDNK